MEKKNINNKKKECLPCAQQTRCALLALGLVQGCVCARPYAEEEDGQLSLAQGGP